ncbi:GNAT family N-acetyltransferase [Oligella ureolytica]|uniref:GNAT family N-acetyltransferase n=1 Tax=Oligella ureolytica TaxID=90244 RepID=UPI0011C0575D|nr:GNAT family N-acetyltransferase [Oligella ureolytica]
MREQKMITSDLPSEYILCVQNFEIGFHKVRYPFDIPLLHKWLNAKHTIEQWKLNKPLSELITYFGKATKDKHQKLFLISCDGVPFGYCEIYAVIGDRLANYYDNVTPFDMGWHVLIGERAFLSKSFAQILIYAISNFVFLKTQAIRIIVEPDVRVKWHVIAEKYAYYKDSVVVFPEKNANIFRCSKENFYESDGYFLHSTVEVNK